MTYSDFTLEMVETAFGLTVQPADLFSPLSPVPVPAWLQDLHAAAAAQTHFGQPANPARLTADLSHLGPFAPRKHFKRD